MESVNVRPGEAVQIGEELVRLGGLEQLELDVATAEIAILGAQNALDNLRETADMNKILALEAITLHTQEVKDAQYELDNYTVPIDQRDLEPMEAVEVMKAAHNQAQQAFEPFRYFII